MSMPKTKASSTPKAKKSQTAKNQPTREEIAVRAYEIYLERGCTPGNELEDWTLAERELLEKSQKPRRKPAPKSLAA